METLTLENVKAQCLCGQVEVPAEPPGRPAARENPLLVPLQVCAPLFFQLLSLCWFRLRSRLCATSLWQNECAPPGLNRWLNDGSLPQCSLCQRTTGGDWMHNIG